MKIKPCFYIRSWNLEQIDYLKRLAELKWPLWVHAEDLQKCTNIEKITQLFAANQLHILSVDVDVTTDHLESAIKACSAQGLTHMVFINQWCDSLIEKILQSPQLIEQSPWSLISFVSQKNEKSVSHKVMQRALNSSQLDYRQYKSEICIYPIFHVQNISLRQHSRLNSTKILVELIKKNISLHKIVVEDDLPEPALTFKDRWLAPYYDLYLLTLASLKEKIHPLKSALSFSMGAFLACTPFYGLQTFLIFVCSYLFRLNFPIAFLGSQISLPPIYSLIVPLQLYIGFQLTGKEFVMSDDILTTAQNHFSAWLVGSVIVGGFLSTTMGFAWYFLQTRTQNKKANWTGQSRGGAWGNQFLFFCIKNLGLKFSYFLLYFVIPYFYFFAPQARRGLNEYWKIRDSKISWLVRQKQIIKTLFVFAQTLMDQVYQASQKGLYCEIRYIGEKAFCETDSDQSRVMVFSHFGGWGVATQGFCKRGFSKPIHIIRYRASGFSQEKLLPNQKDQPIKQILAQPGEPLFLKIHEVLRNKGNLALMGDRPFDNNFELKPLLGRLAPVPTTPFRVAKNYQAKLYMVIGAKKEGIQYSLETVVVDMKEVSVQTAIKIYLQFLERYLQEKPHQWFNLYSYWSSVPTLPNGDICRPTKYQIVAESEENLKK